eukprot:TRINITY_DN954_c0_g1_i1.p3 TRINITY_DN954_c0_g1~~TRINITY_DN954_c0_g1_i1.p3  ORF type:complete len:175 (-),score=61.10 TRINITY_DN954_c0_g1_i1:2023-2547(-)
MRADDVEEFGVRVSGDCGKEMGIDSLTTRNDLQYELFAGHHAFLQQGESSSSSSSSNSSDKDGGWDLRTGLGVATAVSDLENPLQVEIPAVFSEELGKLVSDCCSQNPADRPEFSEIVERLESMEQMFATHNGGNGKQGGVQQGEGEEEAKDWESTVAGFEMPEITVSDFGQTE